MHQVTIKQIAEAVGVSKRASEMRATREAWPYSETTGRGGKRRLYALSQLPAEIQQTLRQQQAIASVNNATELQDGITIASAVDDEARIKAEHNERLQAKEQGIKDFAALPDSPKKERARARKWVIEALRIYRLDHGCKKGAGRHAFVEAFNDGGLKVPAWVRKQMPKYNGLRNLTEASVQRWEEQYLQHGIMSLVDGYGQNKGRSKIEQHPELKQVVLGCMIKHPHITPKKIKEYLEAAHAHLDIVSTKGIERYIKSWKADNAQLWTFITNPDKWKNTYMAAAGSHFERIVRLNQLWEMDSTPGDWMLKDGRHSVLGVIDMYSRRLKFFVSKTSKAMAVCQVLRRALLEWGTPEGVRTDNGKDYVSEQLEEVLNALEIVHEICIPFASEEKGTIERAMRTMSHGVLDLLPGFIGHSVAERKVIEARKSFADRIMTKGEVVECELTSEQLQEKLDQWTDHVYMHDEHGGLDGKTPWQMATSWTEKTLRVSDERALDLLLAQVAGTRTITKKGVRIDGHYYFDPALFEYVGYEALLKYDEQDVGRMAVYVEGSFICWALNPDLAGTSRQEAAAASKAHQKKFMTQQAQELRHYKKQIKDNLPEVILHHRIQQSEKLSAFPQQKEDHTTPGLQAASEAARATDLPKQRMTAHERTAHAELMDEFRSGGVRALRTEETARQRYQRWVRTKRSAASGEVLNEESLHFLISFANTPEWRAENDLHIEFGMLVDKLPVDSTGAAEHDSCESANHNKIGA